MINSVSLKNFRSYKDVFVEFSSGVNVLTGENDSGKSNILRAIHWVVNNRPAGDDVRSNWGGDTSVCLNVEGKLVCRTKSDRENLYSLIHADGKENIFKAFGQGIPDEISKRLSVAPVNINFQLDGPFLLNKSAADVARYYNNVVNLDVIDRTISGIASVLRKEKGELKGEQERSQKLEIDLKQYDWLPEAENRLVQMEELKTQITEMKFASERLSISIHDLKVLEERNYGLNKIVEFEKAALQLQNLSENIKQVMFEQDLLVDEISKFKDFSFQRDRLVIVIDWEEDVLGLIDVDEVIEKLNGEIEDFAEQIENFKDLQKATFQCQIIAKQEKAVLRLINLDFQIEQGSKLESNLKSSIEQFKKLTGQQAIYENSQKRLQNEFERSMPDACPIFDVSCEHLKRKKK